MIDKKLSKEMRSKCSRDYKSRHFWEKQGVFVDDGKPQILWQCSQCELCVVEKVMFVKHAEDENV